MYAVFCLACFGLSLFGVPTKAPQHPEVQKGCPASWVIYMGVVYAFIYFSTDQYVPSLPQMEADLGGSQSLMSGTVQMNLVVKSVFGLLSAGLSDRIGRRPIVLTCTVLLCLTSLCCACAVQVEWFVAARILQGMGESVEPVVFAMARDYFADPETRFRVIAALQMMAFVGIAAAPMYGGLCAEFLNWRLSFIGLSVVWGLLALYAGFSMVECSPDVEHKGYFKDAARILDRHFLSLLLTEGCIVGAYFIFNDNSSYLTETIFGQSVMTSSAVMMVFGALCGVGALIFERLQLGSVLRLGQIAMSLLAVSGMVAFILGLLFSDYLWSYLTGSFLQACVLMMALVSTNVLFFEPLEDVAGMAASFEIVAQSVLPCVLSAFATQSMIQVGPLGLTLWQAGACVAGGLVFWLGYGCPPAWTRGNSSAAGPESLKELCENGATAWTQDTQNAPESMKS